MWRRVARDVARRASTSCATSSSARATGATRGVSATATSRAKAKAKAKAKGKDGEKAQTAASGGGGAASDTKVVGLNYLKTGSDPELGSDDAYPAWLWTLLEAKESLGGYERRIAALKAEGLDWRAEFSEEDAKRYRKLERTHRIRENNASRAKK